MRLAGEIIVSNSFTLYHFVDIVITGDDIYHVHPLNQQTNSKLQFS